MWLKLDLNEFVDYSNNYVVVEIVYTAYLFDIAPFYIFSSIETEKSIMF